MQITSEGVEVNSSSGGCAAKPHTSVTVYQPAKTPRRQTAHLIRDMERDKEREIEQVIQERDVLVCEE